MNLLTKLKAFAGDPPPEYAFEVSEAGIAWVRTEQPAALQWTPLAPGTIDITPMENNVRDPRALSDAVSAILPAAARQKMRRAVLILPDFCARVAVLDFDTFPSDPQDQAQLARFRVKRVVPFDIEHASVACYPQPRTAGRNKVDVVVAVINHDVVSHFEAPFRAAGFQCGFVTISAMSSLSLPADEGDEHASPSIVAKLSGNVLAISLIEGKTLRMFRCVQLTEGTEEEATDILATTFAYSEDELGSAPKVLRLCGIPRESEELRRHWGAEFGLPVTGVQARFGAPGAFNAGLLGYLESVGAS